MLRKAMACNEDRGRNLY